MHVEGSMMVGKYLETLNSNKVLFCFSKKSSSLPYICVHMHLHNKLFYALKRTEKKIILDFFLFLILQPVILAISILAGPMVVRWR